MEPKEEMKVRLGKAPHPPPIGRVFPLATSVLALATAILFLPFASWAGGVVTNCTEADLRAAMVEGERSHLPVTE